MQALTVQDVAEYLLANQPADAEQISNLKLQKLVYYAQGFSLAMLDRPLWMGYRIKAWEHGPVVPDLWHRYRVFGSGPLPAPTIEASRYDVASKGIMDAVLARFGRMSARRLRDTTHREPPWRQARERLRAGGTDVIDESSMREHFVAMVARTGNLQSLSAPAVWAVMRSIPGWEEEAQRGHAEIAEGKGMKLEDLRRLRGL